MTSIGIRHESVQPVTRPARTSSALQRVLLIAGILSSLLYITFDFVAAARYPGYSLRDQAISELSAFGAPTAGFWSAMGPFYGILILAFTIGVLRAAGLLTGWLRRQPRSVSGMESRCAGMPHSQRAAGRHRTGREAPSPSPLWRWLFTGR